MAMVEQLHKELDSRRNEFISTLRETVKIESVSNDASRRQHVVEMAEWIKRFVEQHKPESEVKLVKNVGKPHNGELPPIVTARIGKHSPTKRTLLIYAHYDVQPAKLSDGWSSDPFALVEAANGQLIGRGSTDDKGPLVGWLNVIRTMHEKNIDIPVNIRLIFEGMEESGSEGFDQTVEELDKTTDFFKGVDFCCISDNYWLTTDKPCLTYGLRGLCAVTMTISGPKMDLHSGVFGGQVYQPLDDLLALFGSLKDKDDKIVIPGIYDQVAPVTEAEKKLYDNIHFSIAEKKKEIDVVKIRFEDDKTACLMSVWRNPSLSIHGIEGAVDTPGFKTAIPRTVVGKFSIRLVPNMVIDAVETLVQKHLESEFLKRQSPNKLTVHMESGNWYYVDPSNSSVFQAASRATKLVHHVEPDFTREGGSIPITQTLQKLTGKDVCLLPMGRSDDGAHAQNEKLDVSNYIQGMKVFVAFLYELAAQK